MVKPSWAEQLGKRLRRAARADLAGLVSAVRPSAAPKPGLFTYRVHPPGGSRLLHLRVEADGRGTLLIDVGDVVHLNATAALLAKMALDGRRREEASIAIRRKGAHRKQVDHDVQVVYDLIDHMKTTTDSCPTCDLDSAGQMDLFSAPVEAPYKADLALTYGCNNSCRHCYNEEDRSGTPSLTRGEWKQVLDKLHSFGIPHVIFTGGEPTLHPDLIELIGYAQHLGMVTGVNSNGRRFADEGFVRAVADAGLSHLQMTLQSHRPEIHNGMTGASSFDETVAGVRNALNVGLHTITNTTLTRKNAGDAETVVEFLHDLGLTTFAMNGMIHSGSGCGFSDAIAEDCLAPILVAVRDRATELGIRFLWYTPTPYCQLSPVELGLGPKRCNAGQYTIAIEPDGSVLPCQSYYHSAGNILRDAWSEIWNSGLFRSFRDRTENPRGSGLPEMCWDCPDLSVCGGGCRIATEASGEIRNKFEIQMSEVCSGDCS
jgi:radical SAM protein with 4Fe4S-binding SPASM domain